ncbi:MAG: peptide ABC transporter substrate-binding protein [Chloroflexi bacterium]|nr:peptide ABC transporter substrate-binding protein [Chloroflexota bacterium]
MRYLSHPFTLLALLAALLAGCGASAATPTPTPTPRHIPTSLRWGVAGLSDVPTLDPALASDSTSISLASLIYGGLVRLDEHLHVQPDGARRWSISHGGRVYTFQLRHDLRFPDGRRVTAADFVAALERSLGPDGSAGSASPYLNLIRRGGIRALNTATLQITLVRPAAHFLAELAFPASFVPDLRLLGRYGPAWTDHAAGFGPFFVKSWRHSRYLVLERNIHYYGGTPRLRRITLRFYPQEQDAISAYRGGALDLVSGLPVGERIAPRSPGTHTVPALALDYLAFNTARLPFYRLNARRAFAAVWSPRLASRTMGGSGVPATSFLPPAFGLSVPRWRPQLSPAAYLKLARYPHGKGFRPVVLALERDPHLFALATALSSAWSRALNLDVEVRQLNASDFNAILNARSFDLALVRWGGDYPDPQDFLGTQLGSSADNVTAWTKRPYDAAIRLADSYAPGDSRRMLLFRQAADLAARKVPIVPLDEPTQTALIAPGLTGVALTPLGTIGGSWARAHFS